MQRAQHQLNPLYINQLKEQQPRQKPLEYTVIINITHRLSSKTSLEYHEMLRDM